MKTLARTLLPSLPSGPLARLSLSLCALALAAPASADDARRVQWEYRCIGAPRPADLEPLLDKWGEDGWELAASIATTGNVIQGAVRLDSQLCFKRPRITSLAAQGGSGAAPARDPRASTPVEPAIHWQPSGEELSAARAVLQPTIDRCGADAREDGQAVIALTIIGSGTVTATKAGQSSLSQPTLRCLEEAARSLRFRPFRAALISVDMPVTVHSQGQPIARPAPAPAPPPPSRPKTNASSKLDD